MTRSCGRLERRPLLALVRTMTLLPAKNYNLKRANNDLVMVVLLILFWVLVVILVNPIGNFPLNDDWAFAWTVNILLTTGQFHLSDWTAPNLVPQALIGALFSLPFGFSFTALRFSTLTLALLGVLVTYGLLRGVNADLGTALCGALILALNPLYFVLANSFMTDVPSFAFFMSSVYCIIRGLKRPSTFVLGSGILLSFIAILNRQSSVIIIPALLLAYFLKNGICARTVRNSVLIGTTAVVLYISYSQWLTFTGRVPIMYNTQIDQLLALYSRGFLHIAATYARNVMIMGLYLGLFLFPFLIIVFSIQYKSLSARQKQMGVLPAVFVVATAAVFFAMSKPMPLTGNILNFFDVGGQSLSGYQAFLEPAAVTLIQRGWQLLTVLGVVGAALFLNCLLFITKQQLGSDHGGGKFSANSENERNWLLIFIAALILMYLLGIGGLDRSHWFDRYLILFLPLLMMVASMSTMRLRKTKIGSAAICSAVALLLVYGGVTIAGTHDHLASNRVLWQALNNAMEGGKVKPDQIDGGFEFNGWYFGNKLATCNPAYNSSVKWGKVEPSDFKCLYDNEHWQYQISYVPEAGFVAEEQYHFRRWLPWRDQTLYFLRRLP